VARIADLEEIQADKESPRGGQGYLASLPPRLLALFQSELPPLERVEAGRVLAALGEPREEIMTLEKMVFCRVPKGEFRMGEGKGEHKVDLPEFFISRYPISNAQFDQFVKAEGYKQEKYWQEAKQAGYWSAAGFKGGYDNEARNEPADYGAPFNLSNHPVVGVSWYEALAFARWLTEQLQVASFGSAQDQGYKLQVYDYENDTISLDDNLQLSILNRQSEIQLPSEAEWEKASRGLDAREYPWAGKFNPNFANVKETGIESTSAIGCFPKGKSPYGVLEMSGNVWEWTRSNSDGKEDFQSKNARVLRGGSFYNEASIARCAYRLGNPPGYRSWNRGFRVVVVSPALPSRRL
jgi:formylglycine-generating enzyme required for sulfatase activity